MICSLRWIQNTDDMFSPPDFAGLRTFQADKVGAAEHIKGTRDGAGTRPATVTYDFL